MAADITHWELADGTDIEILNTLDDHSRLLVGSQARGVLKAADVVACFHTAAAAWGFPAALLTDIQAGWALQMLGSTGRRGKDRRDRRPSTVVA